MRGTVLYSPGDIRCEEIDDPKILLPTDAIVRLPPAASVARTSGPIAACSRSQSPPIWATNIAA